MKIILLSAFIDFFGVNASIVVTNERIIQSSGDIFVSSSVFNELSSWSNGGAIQIISKDITNCLIEECIFLSCSTSDHYGGAIFFNGTNFGSIVLNKICAQACNSGSEGWSQFANLWASENKRIEAYYVTVGGATNSGTISLQSSRGIQRFEYNNYSKNSLNECPGVRHYESSRMIHKFGTFVLNEAKNGYIFMVVGGRNNHVEKCNIVKNRIGSDSIIYNYNDAITTYYNCIIYENRGSIYIFKIKSGAVTLQSCVIDNYYFTLTPPNSNSFEIFNNTHDISHFIPENCIYLKEEPKLTLAGLIIFALVVLCFGSFFFSASRKNDNNSIMREGIYDMGNDYVGNNYNYREKYGHRRDTFHRYEDNYEISNSYDDRNHREERGGGGADGSGD